MGYSPGLRPPEQEATGQPDRASQTGAGERRSYAAAYESLTVPFVTRARRELSITLAAQTVFDLERSVPISRRIRRIIRERGGQSALIGLGRRTLEQADLKRIDLLSLRHGLDLLRLGSDDCGVLPAFWRTVASSGGRFAMLCAEMQHEATPGVLLIEVAGGAEGAPVEAIDDAIAHFETEALGVIVHLAPDHHALRRLKGARVTCLAMDFAGVAHEGPYAWSEASRLIAAARDVAPSLMLLNLRPEWGEAAAVAGATHAVFAEMAAVRV